jgi:hypothetical protein
MTNWLQNASQMMTLWIVPLMIALFHFAVVHRLVNCHKSVHPSQKNHRFIFWMTLKAPPLLPRPSHGSTWNAQLGPENLLHSSSGGYATGARVLAVSPPRPHREFSHRQFPAPPMGDRKGTG